MDAVSALLRAAIRIAGASAAIVAYDDDHRPVAFTGCSQGAAAIAMRDGTGAYIDCSTPVAPMTLGLLEASRPTVGDPALMTLANELGHAVIESAARFDGDLAALAAAGAFDMVSVVIRRGLVNLNTPDATRGRVNAVEGVFIGASNDVGAFESGTLAQFLGPVASVAIGGVVTLAIVCICAAALPALRHSDRLTGKTSA